MRSVRAEKFMELSYQFTNKKKTPCKGMVFLKQLLDQIGFLDKVAECAVLSQPASNRAYKLTTLLESFIGSVWCEATRFVYTKFTHSGRILAFFFRCNSIVAQIKICCYETSCQAIDWQQVRDDCSEKEVITLVRQFVKNPINLSLSSNV